MVIYDSLTQTKKELKDKKINIYNCGPTVYNEVHIGNIRPLITFDILHRFLLALKNNVKYVHNITDVDDKIINKAKEENVSESAISEKYTKDYFELMKRLNVLKMNKNPLVTKNIKGIIDYVNRLVKLKKAYVTKQGDVYFSIDSVKDTYGELSKQKIDDLLNGVRKENHSDKKNPLDFVL
jgi:cysteinyl-tRNA synthetase